MLLKLITLPQLAVSALILSFLMVVCGGVGVSVRLYSQCSHGYLRIYPNGSVMAKGSDVGEHYNGLTVSTEDFSLKLLMYAPEVQRYLCFNNKWRLVGLRISKQKALLQARCQFLEDMWEGYITYRSAAEPCRSPAQHCRFMAFSPSGRQQGTRANTSHHCRSFIKKDSSFSITAHNRRVAGEELPPVDPRHMAPSRGQQHKGSHSKGPPPPPLPPSRAPCRPRQRPRLRHQRGSPRRCRRRQTNTNTSPALSLQDLGYK